MAEVRHTAAVRWTHWLTTVAFLALLVSGMEIVVSHPRFYWGESGNVLTPALFQLPIPSSRTTVPTGYEYVLPDQNGWSRHLHFQAAWLAVLTGVFYVSYGVLYGHFRRNLLPALSDFNANSLWRGDDWSYNVVQRLTYLLVVFVLFPVVVWTGLGMSPAVASAFPAVVTVWGGRQSARTIHFFVSLLLLLFLLVHILMVYLAGFRKRTGAMINGGTHG
jgi:thiosulfate reductase cytochrome b subunit